MLKDNSVSGYLLTSPSLIVPFGSELQKKVLLQAPQSYFYSGRGIPPEY